MLHSIFALIVVLVSVAGEVPLSKRSLLLHNWPLKSSKQASLARNPSGKQRTLVVQIRSDQPVPLVLKGRPATHVNGHLGHLHHSSANLHHYARPIQMRPLKLSAPSYHLKAASMLSKPLQFRKPLNVKLANLKLKAAKPSLTYGKPFQFEFPTTTQATLFTAPLPHLTDVKQQLPLETHAHFISDHFAPIHTIPAPNLAPLHDNHIHHEDHVVEVQHQPNNQYQVTEDITNDQTIVDPHSGVQKLYAPDPDPALPAAKLRVSHESYNQPSNGKPLPADVQTNYLPPVAQPLVQIVGAHTQSPKPPVPEIYPIQYAAQPQLQSFSGAHIAAPLPAYLVTHSNNLYTQHQQQQQQLFKPAVASPDTGYVNADLTQEVASDGQILQAAKDPHNNIHPVLDAAPQFAALIAAPSLGEDHHQLKATSLHLPNAAVAANLATPATGFLLSKFFGNAQDAYDHDARQHQQLEAEQQQQQQHLYTQQLQLQELIHGQVQQPSNSNAFEQPQLNNTPLRIFVPDDELEGARIKKRADSLDNVTTEDATTATKP